MPHIRILIFIAIFLLPLITEVLQAQVLPFRHYTVVDGLSSNTVRALSQDSRGYLWIGTADGMCSFDGSTFRRYSGEDGLSFAYVNVIVESKQHPGLIWVATNGGGVFRLQDERFRSYPMGGGEYSERVNALAEDREGTLWCATDDGVYLLNHERVSRFKPTEIVKEIYDLCWLNDSTMWMLNVRESLVYFLRSDRFVHIATPVRFPELLVKLFRDAEGDMWVGGMYGTLIRYHDFRQIERFSLGGYAAPGLDDGEGHIWVGLPEGLVTIAKQPSVVDRMSPITVANGLGKGPFGPMLRDREDNIWLGGVGHGLYKLENRTTVQFPIREANGTGRAVGDGHERIWTAAGGSVHELYRGRDGAYRLHRHSIADERRLGPIVHHALDAKGDLWLVFARGAIHRYRVQHLAGLPSTYSLAQVMHVPVLGEMPVYLYVDRQFRAWCSVTDVGTYLIEPSVRGGGARLLTVRDGLPDNGVRTISQDNQGRMWFGGYFHGAVNMEVAVGGAIRQGSVRNVPTLPDPSVRSILQTRDSTLWIGTRYGGLVYLGPRGSGIVTASDGLPSNTVWSLGEDDAGHVWAGTSQGLARIFPGKTPVVECLDESAGKPIYSLGTLRDSHIWGFSDEGFILYDPTKAKRNTIPPSIQLTRIEVNGTQYSLTAGLELSYDLNNITLEFLGISLHGSRPVRYQYRLDGADDDWHEPTITRSVNYAAISPGRYTFLVRAINADGVQSPSAAGWSFVIRPPFWKSWWFLLLSVLFSALTIAFVVRSRLRRLLAIERVRSRIATDLHDDIGASLTRITLFSNTALEELRGKPGRRSGRREGKTRALLEEIRATSRELVDSMSDIVWAIDPKSDSFDEVLLRMKTYAGRVLEAKHIDYAVDIPHDVSRLELPLEFRRNVFLMFKETMTNIVRHSAARTVRIRVRMESGHIVMVIADDGVGFNPERESQGNGIRNLRKRAALIGGRVDIDSRAGRGTTITVRGRIP